MVKPLLWLLFVSLLLVVWGCARQKIAIEMPRLPEREGVYHVVERHQTLYRICKTYGVDIHEVASLNGIADPGRIQVGQRIFIPGARQVLKVGIYLDDVIRESFEIEKEKLPDRVSFIWPVEGPCVEFFTETGRRKHQGIDVTSPPGTPIKASASGVVLYSGSGIRGYGNVIILRHSEEFVSVYAHNQVNLVVEGTRVEKGEVIGKVGQTGNATGPHLHFEIRKENKAVDPLPFLQ